MSTSNPTPQESEGFGRYSRAQALYFSGELRRAGMAPCRGARVVEVGFGAGSFARWALDQGCFYSGVELNPDHLASARRAGFRAYSPDVSWEEAFGRESLDLIAAFDVLEHMAIREIRTLLRSTHACLKAGGLFLARVPSGDSPFSGAIWTGDLTHRTLLGSSAIISLASEAGFMIARIGSPMLPIWGLGLRAAGRRVVAKSVQVVAHGLISRVLIGRRNAVVAPNMVFTLRKPL